MTGQRNEWLARAGLVMVSLIVTLMMLELGCRLLRGPEWLTNWRNLVLKERIDTRSQGVGRLKPDPGLGFVAVPGFGRDDRHYDEHGFRVAPNPDGVALAEPPILVEGDSIAHGDEIADGETWPSRLQLLLRRRVLNGGMSGYGFDQIVLAAEKAVAEAKPAAIILSFTADDTRRNEMKRVWGAEKPYFELVNGKLTLRNTPALCAASAPARPSGSSASTPNVRGEIDNTRTTPSSAFHSATWVSPRTAISSMPPAPCTTAARRNPSAPSAAAIGSHHFASYTPTTWCLTFAGFVSGPSRLKIVRVPSSLRGPLA